MSDASDKKNNKYYEELQRKNNPHNEPIGPFTGRCKRCGSKDLWDDNMTYGCNVCDAIYFPSA